MPIRLPFASTSAPPELPGCIVASVWMKLSKVVMPSCVRPSALTMPERDGLPDAERDCRSRARRRRRAPGPAFANVIAGSCGRSILSTARSVSGSVPDHARRHFSRVGERDFDLVHRLDDVVVGEDVALLAHDDARAQPLAALHAGVALLAEEIAENRVVHERMPRALDLLAGVDVDDRGHRLARRAAERGHGRPPAAPRAAAP